MPLGDRIRSVLSLQDERPDVQSREDRGQYGFFSVSSDVDRVRPERGDVEKYWEQYQACPLVKMPINQWAEDVLAPGVSVEADDPELAEQLEEWASNSAIIAGEADRDLDELLDHVLVQEAVRGTVLVEIVPMDEEDGIYGFKTINVATVSAYTYDSQSVLIRPEDTDLDEVKTTPRGEAAAYGQWDAGALGAPFDGKETVYLSQNDALKFVRDPDTSDIWGTSTIHPVSAHIDELQRMLADTADAVHNKAFPHWLFKMGEPTGDSPNPRDGVWPEDKIKKLRKQHERDNWEPGDKDFVPGDVDLETFESDVPEIEDLLNWYVEIILSAMPVPRAKVGFAGDINRDVVGDQLEQYERKVEAKRDKLEDAFTPVFQDKAEELGYSESVVDSVALRIEESVDENPLQRESFEADEFAQFAKGLKDVSGGNPQAIVEADEVREMLGLSTDDESGTTESAESADTESDVDDDVAVEFEDLFGEPAVPDAVDEAGVGLDDDGLGVDVETDESDVGTVGAD